jgi:hypothetical protein
MIHQFILAAPKPGLTATEFQDYWRTVHAVRYASKIPQITRYLIDSRIPFDGDWGAGDWGTPALPHQGIAEIWLNNEEEQLASLQTPEFLQGARLDEPNWAAFWLTLVLDTTAYEIVPGPPLTETDPDWVKLTVLSKRAPGLPLEEFRSTALGPYAAAVSKLPGLRRYLQAHTRDGAYVFGEASFDSVEQLWFDSVDDLRTALASPAFTEQVAPVQATLVDPKYVFSLVARENWIIGPEARS